MIPTATRNQFTATPGRKNAPGPEGGRTEGGGERGAASTSQHSAKKYQAAQTLAPPNRPQPARPLGRRCATYVTQRTYVKSRNTCAGLARFPKNSPPGTASPQVFHNPPTGSSSIYWDAALASWDVAWCLEGPPHCCEAERGDGRQVAEAKSQGRDGPWRSRIADDAEHAGRSRRSFASRRLRGRPVAHLSDHSDRGSRLAHSNGGTP